MKRIFTKNAITLLELIISTALVSVVLLGIFAIHTVLNNNNQDYGQRYYVKSETQATLNHILNNASLAVGSGTWDIYNNYDIGILAGSNPPSSGGMNDANSFCIHQAGGNNITGNSSDIWLCYTWYPSTDPNYPNQIEYCTFSYVSATSSNSLRGANSCKTSNSPVTGPIYLGTAYSISNLNGNVTPPVFTVNNNQMLFSITIQNCLNDALASCQSSGTSSDPADNPEVQLTGSVIPLQEGMQQS